MAESPEYNLEFVKVTFPADGVAHVELNRPEKMNSFNAPLFTNMCKTFDMLSFDPNVRCVMLSGAGDRAFSTGLDVVSASQTGPVSKPDPNKDFARRTWAVRRHILDWQDCVTSIERCDKPVIALLHGVVYGAGIDVATAADIRYVAKGARLSIKEVDVGLAADVGTLSRLPKIGVPYSWAKEVVYTARVFGPEEALKVGFATRVFESKDELIKEGLELATNIANKSPVAVQSSKALLDYSRDRSVDEGLRFTAAWNASAVQAQDVSIAMQTGLKKGKPPKFEKL